MSKPSKLTFFNYLVDSMQRGKCSLCICIYIFLLLEDNYSSKSVHMYYLYFVSKRNVLRHLGARSTETEPN